MKNLTLLLIGFFISSLVTAQDVNYPLETKKNAAVITLGGLTYIYSIGYERVLFAKNRHALAVKAGGMLFPKAVGLHTGVAYLYFIKRSALEAGLSYSNFNDKSSGWINLSFHNAIAPNIGYRYYTKNNKLLLKGGMNLLISKDTGEDFLPWPYVGVGFRF